VTNDTGSERAYELTYTDANGLESLFAFENSIPADTIRFPSQRRMAWKRERP